MSKKPNTDDDARKTCVNCKRFNGKTNTCALLGPVTVTNRQFCHRAGYADFRFQRYTYGKLPHYPPAE